jgi:hypothetical protein
VPVARPACDHGPVPTRLDGSPDFTSEQRRARRRNRQWLGGLAAFSIVVLTLALIASAVAESNSPNGPSLVAPAGYKTVRDGYYAYAVPADWSTNPSFTDSAGDVETSGAGGLAAEHIAYRASAPAPGEVPPASFSAVGALHPEPLSLSPPVAISVPGAAAAYSYRVSRPGGFRAVALDVWDSRTAVELWLLVEAAPDVTSVVVSTLRA